MRPTDHQSFCRYDTSSQWPPRFPRQLGQGMLSNRDLQCSLEWRRPKPRRRHTSFVMGLVSADKTKSSPRPAPLQMPSIVVWETEEDREKPMTHITGIGKTASRLLASRFAHISSVSAAWAIHPNAGLRIQLELIEAALSVPLGNTKRLTSWKLQMRQGCDVG